MSPKRSMRTLLAGALSLSLLAALLAIPGVALAGLPNWVIIEEGNTTDPAAVELPARAEPGENAGYSVTIKNIGPSNISQLFFFADDSAPGTEFVAPSQGSCSPVGEPLACTLGSLSAGSTATIVVAFATPENAPDGSLFVIDFFFNTTGLGSEGGSDSSHGDELHAEGATLLSTDDDFAGGFRLDQEPVGNLPISGAGNQQSTTVFPPQANLPIVVADGDAVVGDPGCPEGLTCILETSQLQVGQGETFDELFKVVILIDKTALRGISLKSIDVVHILDDETPVPIDDACPRRGAPTGECVTIAGLPGGHAQVTLWLFQNGWVKYH